MFPVLCLGCHLSNKGSARGGVGRLIVSRVRSCACLRCAVLRSLFRYEVAVLKSHTRALSAGRRSMLEFLPGLLKHRVQAVRVGGDCQGALRVTQCTRGIDKMSSLRLLSHRKGRIMRGAFGASARLLSRLIYRLGYPKSFRATTLVAAARRRTFSLDHLLGLHNVGMSCISHGDSTFGGNLAMAAFCLTGKLRFSRIFTLHNTGSGPLGGRTRCVYTAETLRRLCICRVVSNLSGWRLANVRSWGLFEGGEGVGVALVAMKGVGRGCLQSTVTRCDGQLDQCYGLRVVRMTSRGAPSRTDSIIRGAVHSGRTRHVVGCMGRSACIVALRVGKGLLDSRRLSTGVGRLKVRKADRVAFVVNKSVNLNGRILTESSCTLDFSGVAFPRRLVQIVLLRRVCEDCQVVGNRPCRG